MSDLSPPPFPYPVAYPLGTSGKMVCINPDGSLGTTTISGDVTLNSMTGLTEVLSTNGVPFSAVATSNNYNDLSNLPSIPAAQVNSDWNASSGVSQILNKPSIPSGQVNSDWNASSGVAQILNKPTIPSSQIQSNWNETNSAFLDYIQNKPTNVSDFTNDIGYINSSVLSMTLFNYVTSTALTSTLSGYTTSSALTTALAGYVPTSRTVNGHALSSNVTISASDVGAPSGSGSSTGTNTGDQTNISGNAATVTTNANLTGPVTSVGNTTTITNAAVTYAKIQNESASTLLGNPTGSAAAPSEITLGNGLVFSGTTVTALRTTSVLTLSLVGTGATGTQISATKDSTVRCSVSTSTTSTIGGPSTSVVALKICATNNATEGSWTTVATFESDQNITLAIALQSIQVVKDQLCTDVPAGWYVKLVNSGTGTHAETYLSGQQTIYG